MENIPTGARFATRSRLTACSSLTARTTMPTATGPGEIITYATLDLSAKAAPLQNVIGRRIYIGTAASVYEALRPAL
jgi:hypothetical protein